MKLIDLEELQKYPIRRDHYDAKNGNEHFVNGIESLMEYAEALHTINPKDLRAKGRWDTIRNAYGDIEGWLCQCGRESKSKDNYCPNCGAKMEGDQ